MSILIEHARIVDARADYNGCIGIKNGKINFVGETTNEKYDTMINADGLVVMPAFTDTHCHLRDPGQTQKESMETGMRAAIKGGYCALTAMANTTPVISTPELVEQNLVKAKKLDLCELIQVASCGQNLGDEVTTDRRALRKYTNVFSNDGKTIFSDSFMEKLLYDSNELDFVVSTHSQPESQIVERDLKLLEKTGGNLHIGHISEKKTVDLIRAAKNKGLKFTCEVTPHHLVGHDCDYAVNPPMLTKTDNEALIQAIKDGVIDCLATDHAPHTPLDKQNGMAGISNIEYALQIFLKIFYDNDIPLTRLAEMTSLTPRKILGLKGGLINVGEKANLVIIDPVTPSTVNRSEMISRSNNTPFDGIITRGKVITTIIKGNIIYDNGRFIR